MLLTYLTVWKNTEQSSDRELKERVEIRWLVHGVHSVDLYKLIILNYVSHWYNRKSSYLANRFVDNND